MRLNQQLQPLESRVLFTTFDEVANTSVIHDGQRFIMAYEVKAAGGGQFYPRLASSPDLSTWQTLGHAFRPEEYTACPTIRYANSWYYIFYLASHKLPKNTHAQQEYGFSTRVARTQNFQDYESSHWFQLPTFMAPNSLDGPTIVNNSDLDLIEHAGQT